MTPPIAFSTSPSRPLQMPRLCHHKASGRAVVRLNGVDHYTGLWGSSEATEKYEALIAEWLANHRLPGTEPVTVNELILAFLRWAEVSYHDHGRRKAAEVEGIKQALKIVRRLYGRESVASFGPKALKAVRQEMLKLGWCRAYVNRQVNRVKRCFRWGVSEELTPATTLHALCALPPLRKGTPGVRESDPVEPVADAVVAATVPCLNPTVRAMVELQRLTGMRPGEVCRLRLYDLDMTGHVWLYAPAKHKTAWKGKRRVVAIGPKGQAILKPFLPSQAESFVFSPARAVEERRRELRGKRRSRVQPSQVCRKKPDAKKRPGDQYTPGVLAHAIVAACDKAFPPPPHLARGKVKAKRGAERWETNAEWKARPGDEGWANLKEWRAAHRWHPNQLRHAHATEVRKRYGLEAAQVVLGHSRADVTQVYAERDLTLAERVAGEIG